MAYAALLHLSLIAFADSLNTAGLSGLINPSGSLAPGFWNVGTTSLILSTVSDLTGQLFLGYLADRKGIKIATVVNALSVCSTGVFLLISLVFSKDSTTSTAVVPPLLRLLGGSSHATAFLVLAILHQQKSEPTRAISFYLTGALLVISQQVGTFLLPILSTRCDLLPYLLSILCCLACCYISLFHIQLPPSLQDERAPSPTESDPLLHSTERRETRAMPGATTIRERIDGCARSAVTCNKNSPLILLFPIFFLAGIAKATRPLFTTYIQHRDGINASQSQQLWLLRSCLSVIIFGLFPPAVVRFSQSRGFSSTSPTALWIARLSIILMGTGALLIGLAESLRVLLPALIINTLGVATDLSLLVYLAGHISNSAANRGFLLIASLESAGILIGIGTLYPIYQWSAGQISVAGGAPYYICAAIYAVVGLFIWQLEPASPAESDNDQ